MEAIKEILKKLSDALIQLQQLSELTAEKNREAGKIQTESLQRLAAVETREKAATLMEGRIRSNEKLDEEQNTLLIAQSDLKNSQKTFDKKCSEREAVLSQEESDLDSGLKDLKEQKKKLEEEKETYKKTLLDKMGG